MASGTPDYITRVQVAVTVLNVPVVLGTATEGAAGASGRYSGILQTYQTVASWTVATAKVGELKEILIISSSYSKTSLQITVGDIVFTTAWLTQGSMPLIFEDLKLVAGKVVKIEAKSTDGTAITVDAVIMAKEIG